MKHNLKSQSGFTLVEVLVSTVILSLGLLGLAGMQTTSMRYNQDAYLRSQAVTVANDIIDRMRTNQDGVVAGNYDAIDSRNDAPADQGCAVTPCTAIQIASQDIREWTDHFQDVYALGDAYTPTLPSGAFGTVTNNAGTYSVVITWTEMATLHTDAGNPATKTFTITMVL